MKLKQIIVEDFVNYKLPAMFIATSICNWKCCKEQNLDIRVCQNAPLSNSITKEISNQYIFEQFINNPITKAIVIGGLEPMLQFDEVIDLIDYFRSKKEFAPFVIYTGYYPEEIKEYIERLKKYKNIIVKFGRYKQNDNQKYDEILGVMLASSNQYAKVIS